MEMIGGSLDLFWLYQIHSQILQRIVLPVQLPLPSIMGNLYQKLFVLRPQALFFNSRIIKCGDIIHRLRLLPLILHGMIHPYYGKAVVELPYRADLYPGQRILCYDLQKTAFFISSICVRYVFHTISGSRDDKFIAVALMRAVKSRQIQLHKVKSRLFCTFHDLIFLKRQG